MQIDTPVKRNVKASQCHHGEQGIVDAAQTAWCHQQCGGFKLFDEVDHQIIFGQGYHQSTGTFDKQNVTSLEQVVMHVNNTLQVDRLFGI